MKYALLLLLMISLGNNLQAQSPFTDPNNMGGWILNEDLSDEFNVDGLDKDKWWILGENGDYRKKWKGRAPGQFVAHNVEVVDGNLIIKSQWEPDYSFINEKNNDVYYGGTATAADNSKPITQACIMSEGFFKYGYMEIRSKAADAPVTSSFWTTGYRSEIDMTENYGKRPIDNPMNKPASLETKYRTNVISWEPNLPDTHKEWKFAENMDVRIAADYNVFGFEWNEDYIKLYFNDKLIKTATRQELEANGQWVIKHPMELWVDSEVFDFMGLPSAQDLLNTAEYKIDYIRIFQKKIRGPYFDAFGFEGPFFFNGHSSNWWSANNSAFSMTTDKALTGDASLLYKQTTALTGTQSISAPYGSLDLPNGSNNVSFKVWKETGCQVKAVTLRLRNPFKKLSAIDISSLPEGQWSEVSLSFTRNASVLTGDGADRLEILVEKANGIGTNNTFYIDDIRFDTINEDYIPVPTAIKEVETLEACVYPNPTCEVFKVSSLSATEVSLYNASGVKLKSLCKVDEPMEVSVADLKSGVYLVKIADRTGAFVTEKIQVN